MVGGEEEVDEEDAPNERVRPRERRVAETICVAFEMLVFQHVMRLPPPSLGRVINTACNGLRVRFHPWSVTKAFKPVFVGCALLDT